MKKIEYELEKELHELEILRKDIEGQLEEAPEGALRIARNKGKALYYQYNKEQPGAYRTGTYIKKDNMELAKALAQKDYNRKLLLLFDEELKLIGNMCKNYQKKKEIDIQLENLKSTLSEERKNLIDSDYLTDSEYARQWQEEVYQGKTFVEGMVEIYTDKGERVRSKSEKILADHLNRRGIPYKYEYPFRLKNGYTIYPDFTVLNVSTRTEFCWEHLGMMDNKDYANEAIRRIQEYGKNGMCVGCNLLVTFETSSQVLRTRDIDLLIDQYLIN